MKKILLSLALVMAFSSASFAADFIIAHDTNFKPFEFKGEDGKYTGFDIELWDAIAKIAGIEYKFQPMDFNGIIPALQAKSVDGAVAGMTITPERAKVVDFSDGYYDSGLMLLVRADDESIKSIDDLAGKVVATKTATSSAEYMKAFGKAKEIKLFPNNDGMFFELMAKGADAVLFDMPVVTEFALGAGKDKVKTVGQVYEGQSYGIAFVKGTSQLEKVNAALAQMKKDGSYETLYIKWFGYAPVLK